MCNLGFCYEKGLGVGQDKIKAFLCYFQAKKLGSEIANFNINFFEKKTIQVPPDYLTTLRLLKDAKETFDVRAYYYANYCWELKRQFPEKYMAIISLLDFVQFLQPPSREKQTAA